MRSQTLNRERRSCVADVFVVYAAFIVVVAIADASVFVVVDVVVAIVVGDVAVVAIANTSTYVDVVVVVSEPTLTRETLALLSFK